MKIVRAVFSQIFTLQAISAVFRAQTEIRPRLPFKQSNANTAFAFAVGIEFVFALSMKPREILQHFAVSSTGRTTVINQTCHCCK
jgi:hypothetical protein